MFYKRNSQDFRYKRLKNKSFQGINPLRSIIAVLKAISTRDIPIKPLKLMKFLRKIMIIELLDLKLDTKDQ